MFNVLLMVDVTVELLVLATAERTVARRFWMRFQLVQAAVARREVQNQAK
jgi:hypothetical protein